MDITLVASGEAIGRTRGTDEDSAGGFHEKHQGI